MTTDPTIWTAGTQPSMTLEIYLLGLVDFDSSLLLQEQMVDEIKGRDDRMGRMLVCEHPPLVTVGREGSLEHVLAEPCELVARQMETRWLNRGGGCLVHAPGQLALYPVVPLDRLGCGLVEYRARLELAVIGMCRELRVPAYRRVDKPGVWCRCGQFAFLGATVKSQVTHHGIFINVCPDLDVMRLVQSNGKGERVTSLSAQQMRPMAMHTVRESMIRNLAARLGYEQYHLYTGHPQLRRTKRRVYAPA